MRMKDIVRFTQVAGPLVLNMKELILISIGVEELFRTNHTRITFVTREHGIEVTHVVKESLKDVEQTLFSYKSTKRGK